jgi:hypothetical protein
MTMSKGTLEYGDTINMYVGDDIKSSHMDGIYCVYENQRHFLFKSLRQNRLIKLTIKREHFAYIKLKGPPKKLSGSLMNKLTYKYNWFPPKSKEGDSNWCWYFEYDTL